jgi:Zn-finger nucleic acid-binding protein
MKRKANVEEKMSLELKYCERCGGLWLRPAGGGQIYCVSCAKQMAEMPPASGRFDSSAEDLSGRETFIHEASGFCEERMFGELAGGEF